MKKYVEKTSFPEKLIEARNKHGYSGNYFAKLIGVSQPTYSSWETGRTEPSLFFLLKISQLLHCSIDYLLGNVIENKTPSVDLHHNNANTIIGISNGDAINQQKRIIELEAQLELCKELLKKGMYEK